MKIYISRGGEIIYSWKISRLNSLNRARPEACSWDKTAQSSVRRRGTVRLSWSPAPLIILPTAYKVNIFTEK